MILTKVRNAGAFEIDEAYILHKIWLSFDEGIEYAIGAKNPIVQQLYAQMMGWA